MSIPRSARRAVLVFALLMLIPNPAAALSPSNSLLLYKPGKAVTGVLAKGAWTRKASFALRGVSLAAASRDSLALYTGATGKLRTGRFRDGRYTPAETSTVRTGFTHAVASCDTLLLYNATTMRCPTECSLCRKALKMRRRVESSQDVDAVKPSARSGGTLD